MRLRLLLVLPFALVLTGARSVHAQPSGKYLQVATDQLITSTTTLLSTTISLGSTSNVFFESDGRFYRQATNAQGNMYITVDGVRSSNHSIIQWAQSTNAQQHSYNTAGAKTLAAGTHTIALVAQFDTGAYYVGAGSNLSVLINVASTALYTETAADSSLINVTTAFLTPNGIRDYDNLPRTTLLSRVLNSGGADIIALASGRSYVPNASRAGDAMWGIYFDGHFVGWNNPLGSTALLWGVNDLFVGAELQAPMSLLSGLEIPKTRETLVRSGFEGCARGGRYRL